MDLVTDAKILEVSRDWACHQRTGADRYYWAVDEAQLWSASEDFALMSRFVLALAEQIEPDEEYVVAMLGAGPLEDLVEMEPETALPFLRKEIAVNETLREALTGVWSRTNHGRIDEMLRPYGKRGAGV